MEFIEHPVFVTLLKFDNGGTYSYYSISRTVPVAVIETNNKREVKIKGIPVIVKITTAMAIAILIILAGLSIAVSMRKVAQNW